MMENNKLYVQYGAGSEAVKGWLSFDASPTLRLQKIPIVGRLLRNKLNCIFDHDIQFGDVVKGLPLNPESVDGLFCSHVLEHLSYVDCLTALKNSFAYLKRGGVFRILVRDLAYYIDNYQQMQSSGNPDLISKSSYMFCRDTYLGLEVSRSSIRHRLLDAFGGSAHRWMWDEPGLTNARENHGFVNIKRFQQDVCEDEMFLRPERKHQFGNQEGLYGLALECRKP